MLKPQLNLSLPLLCGIALIVTVLMMVQPVPSKIAVEIPPPCEGLDCEPSDVPLTLRSQRAWSTELELMLQKEGKR